MKAERVVAVIEEARELAESSGLRVSVWALLECGTPLSVHADTITDLSAEDDYDGGTMVCELASAPIVQIAFQTLKPAEDSGPAAPSSSGAPALGGYA